MKPAARVNDAHECQKHGGDKIIQGSPNIFINGKPAARVGDHAVCKTGEKAKIKTGSSSVTFNGMSAATQDSLTDHDGKITSGSSNVMIGSSGRPVTIGNKGTVHIGGNGKPVSLGKAEDIAEAALGVIGMAAGILGDEAGAGEVIQIAGYKLTKHALERMAERKVSKKAIEDALKKPLKVDPVKVRSDGKPSQVYTGKDAQVAVNPENGNIVSVNPTHSRVAKKLMGN